MSKTIEFMSDNMLLNGTLTQEQADYALEQLRNERRMLFDAESARVRARYDLTDAVTELRTLLRAEANNLCGPFGLDQAEDLLGNITRQADNYARKAQELGNIEGRQGK